MDRRGAGAFALPRFCKFNESVRLEFDQATPAKQLFDLYERLVLRSAHALADLCERLVLRLAYALVVTLEVFAIGRQHFAKRQPAPRFDRFPSVDLVLYVARPSSGIRTAAKGFGQ